MITELRFPRCTGAGWAFEKFNKRAQDWAIVGVAAVGGERPGVGLVNMAATPVRATSVEAAMRAGATT
jgi:carbon-monoxide dehydrogenase medium subunit